MTKEEKILMRQDRKTERREAAIWNRMVRAAKEKGAWMEPAPPRPARTLFEIDFYDLQVDCIDVNIIRGEDEKTISIRRDLFEKWLKSTERLDWVIDSVDHAGGHAQEAVHMTAEDYWNDTSFDKRQDIYEFLVLKAADPCKIFNLPFTTQN